jgi:hypothetical protein
MSPADGGAQVGSKVQTYRFKFMCQYFIVYHNKQVIA